MNSRPDAPVSSAATNAQGGTLVPGCMSIRNVSHLPPANAISEFANAAPPFVTRAPSGPDPATQTRFLAAMTDWLR